MDRKLVAALACRNNGTRLFGKPVQNLDVKENITILDNIIQCLSKIPEIKEIVLGISCGDENKIFIEYAKKYNIKFIIGDEIDVLSRLIACGKIASGTDIFRVTSESPFVSYELVNNAWKTHLQNNTDAVFLDEVIDGCSFEIIKLDVLIESHENIKKEILDLDRFRHRSEMCTLYIRENVASYKIRRLEVPKYLNRKDLRLTVDNPEDLVVCRKLYAQFKEFAPMIPLNKVVSYLDENLYLINMMEPFLEIGYSTMYIWEDNNKIN